MKQRIKMSLFISRQANDYKEQSPPKEKYPIAVQRFRGRSTAAVIPLNKRVTPPTRELFNNAEKECLLSNPLTLLRENPDLFLAASPQGAELRWWLQITNLSALALSEVELKTIRAVNETFPELFTITHRRHIPRIPIGSGTSLTFIPKNLLFLEMGRPMSPEEESFASFYQGGNLPLETPEQLINWCELIEETNDPHLIKAFIKSYLSANVAVYLAGLESEFDICKLVFYVRQINGFYLPMNPRSEKIQALSDSARQMTLSDFTITFNFETLTLGFQPRYHEWLVNELPTSKHKEFVRLLEKYPYITITALPPPRFTYNYPDDYYY